MPRVIVTADTAPSPAQSPALLDEHVKTVHLSTGHAAAQLIERIAWAISDAEEAEAASSRRRRVRRPSPRTSRRPAPQPARAASRA